MSLDSLPRTISPVGPGSGIRRLREVCRNGVLAKVSINMPLWGLRSCLPRYVEHATSRLSNGFDRNSQVVGAADNLRVQTIVNGELRQDSNTNDMLFNVAHIVSFVSQGTTLEAGTVIMTGTPAGVAMGMNPPKYLRNGDVVEVAIENLGSTRNVMVFE